MERSCSQVQRSENQNENDQQGSDDASDHIGPEDQLNGIDAQEGDGRFL